MSLGGTTVPVKDDNGDTREATLQQIHDELTDPIKSSYQLNTAAGSALSFSTKGIAKTGISNGVATDVLTVTVPNAAHSAFLVLDVLGILGAGGSIGANEAVNLQSFNIGITRTAGLATVKTVSSAIGGTGSIAVAGATTCAVTVAVSSNTGANGAEQTFTVQVTISRGSGSSTNHVAMVRYTLANHNGTGITVAAA